MKKKWATSLFILLGFVLIGSLIFPISLNLTYLILSGLVLMMYQVSIKFYKRAFENNNYIMYLLLIAGLVIGLGLRYYIEIGDPLTINQLFTTTNILIFMIANMILLIISSIYYGVSKKE